MEPKFSRFELLVVPLTAQQRAQLYDALGSVPGDSRLFLSTLLLSDTPESLVVEQMGGSGCLAQDSFRALRQPSSRPRP